MKIRVHNNGDRPCEGCGGKNLGSQLLTAFVYSPHATPTPAPSRPLASEAGKAHVVFNSVVFTGRQTWVWIFCHVLVVGPWASYLILSGFLTCKMSVS